MATFMPVFPPHFQPAESIRVHAGPRKRSASFLPALLDGNVRAMEYAVGYEARDRTALGDTNGLCP